MKTVQVSERGQVLIIFVFAIIGLIGIAGLAIDGGYIFSDRRHAQNAADTASMAGALFRVGQEKYHGASTADCGNIPPTAPLGGYGPCASAIINTAKNMANTNGYVDNITDSTVEVHTPPVDGPYADCSKPALFDCHDYVQVIINTNVNTFFARILGVAQTHNRVEALALARYVPQHPVYGGLSLIQLGTSPGCGGDFILGGSATVTLNNGGIFVNSANSNCAFKETNNCVTLVLNNAGVQSVGGVFNSGCSNAPTVSPATTTFPSPPNPPLLTQPPAECNQAHAAPTTQGGVTTYHPGNYNSALPSGSNVKLAPGVYCVTDIQTQNSDNIDGTAGVFVYIKPNGNFSFNGGTVRLAAPGAGQPYQGYLIYVDSTFTGGHPNCTINGGASDSFTGLIYAPWCDVKIAGNGTPLGLSAQMIGYTMELSGTSTLTFTFSADLVPQIPEVNLTGLYH